MRKIFKLAEFFSGPGGMGLGAGLSKVKSKKNSYAIEHAWASDYHQASCDTYKRNIRTKAVFCEKVENFFNLVDKKKIILPKFDCFISNEHVFINEILESRFIFNIFWPDK